MGGPTKQIDRALGKKCKSFHFTTIYTLNDKLVVYNAPIFSRCNSLHYSITIIIISRTAHCHIRTGDRSRQAL